MGKPTERKGVFMFMEEFIASGFWKALGFLIIAGTTAVLPATIFKVINDTKKQKGEEVSKFPQFLYFILNPAGLIVVAIAWLHVWQIRDGIGWLIFGIMAAIMAVVSTLVGMCGIIGMCIGKKKPTPAQVLPIITDETLPGIIQNMVSKTTFPVLVNADARLDSVVAIPGKKIMDTYTLLNAEVGQKFTSEELSALRNAQIENLKSVANANTDLFRRSGVAYVFRYMDKEQNQIGIIEIGPNYY